MAEKLLKEEDSADDEDVEDVKKSKDKKSKKSKSKSPKSDSDNDGSEGAEDSDEESDAGEKEEKPKKALTHKEKKALEKKKKMEAEIARMSTKGGSGHSALDANFTVAQVWISNTWFLLRSIFRTLYFSGFENGSCFDEYGERSGHKD